MKSELTIEIECGLDTCASEPGKFCKYLWMGHFISTCCIFGDLEDRDGWIQRHKNCLKNSIQGE